MLVMVLEASMEDNYHKRAIKKDVTQVKFLQYASLCILAICLPFSL